MKSLILASGSPSRKQILEEAHIPFKVIVSDYEEDMTLALSPADLAVYLSQGKAKAVATRQPGAVILAADSFGVFQGTLLGKPHTMERARQMLAALSGHCHTFVTGFTIIDSDTQQTYSEAVETKVYFHTLTPQQITDYLASEDVLEKAGAYSINDLGGKLVKKLEGDHSNVRGLPLHAVTAAMQAFDIDWPVVA